MVPVSTSVSRQRSERRISVHLPLMVRGRDKRGVLFEEETSSENLCRSGAAFLTRFDVAIGSGLSTRGLAGGVVVDGRLLVGRGSAGEIGHVCAKPGGRRCNCGLRGCVEAYAGRGALEARARREARKRKTVLFDLMRRRGRDQLTSGVWLRALDAGDAVAHDLLREAVDALGVGIGSAVTLLDVEAVIVGGGLGERLGPAWLQRIEKAAAEHTFFREPPAYRLAELGDMGGAIGASLLGPGRRHA